MSPLSPLDAYWSHVWAVPCNGVPECGDGRDEMNCQMPNWVLEFVLLGIVCVLCLTLFIYLSYYVEHTIIDKNDIISSFSELNLTKRILDIAILVEQGNIDNIHEFYDKEVERHGNEANAICCLKVHCYMLNWLFILVYLPKIYRVRKGCSPI